MELLDQYFEIQRQIHEYFGYAEDWRTIPLDDRRDYFWRLEGEGPGQLHYAETEDELFNEDGAYYMDEIFTQRHLPRWVYRGENFTMVSCNPGSDENVFLRILDNSKEQKPC
jgi:hypothetical protein